MFATRCGSLCCNSGLVVLTVAGRSFEDEKKAKMGIVECVKHSLIEPFTVLYEREGIFGYWLLAIASFHLKQLKNCNSFIKLFFLFSINNVLSQLVFDNVFCYCSN